LGLIFKFYFDLHHQFPPARPDGKLGLTGKSRYMMKMTAMSMADPKRQLPPRLKHEMFVSPKLKP